MSTLKRQSSYTQRFAMNHNKHEFDEYAKQYRETMDKNLWLSGESSSFFAEYKAQKLKEWFPELAYQPIKILDFGCGDGLMTSFVQALFPKAQVYGVDPSAESIEVAQMAYKNIKFTVSSLPLECEDNSFDLIFSAGVFHHILFSEHTRYVQDIQRILKPNGSFVLFELNPFNPLTVITFKRNPIDKNARMMFPGYSKKLLTQFGAVRTNYYCFFPKTFHKLRCLEPYLTKLPLGALYASILKKSPSLLAQGKNLG